ncbi:MAG: ribosome small subunit-dependent GTPase A [Candidatus Eisenbacteria bacterium]
MSPTNPSLIDLGWNEAREREFREAAPEGCVPGRICRHVSGRFYAWTGGGKEVEAERPGRLGHRAGPGAGLPAVGDWVVLRLLEGEPKGTIESILSRTSVFSRKSAGRTTREQLVAANVDTLFLVTGLDGDFNVRRIERYLTLGWESGAEPVVILNKADLRGDAEECADSVRAIAPNGAVIAVSALDGRGFDDLGPWLGPGRTVALLGSSGAGKSSIINRLAGEDVARTAEVREADSRGRHTTTHREMIVLPSGAILVDSPGMREIQLWGSEKGLASAFGDVESLAGECRFRDCAHGSEPGCAVRAAVASGGLSEARLDSYLRLRRELGHLRERRDEKIHRNTKGRWKAIHKEWRRFKKNRGH